MSADEPAARIPAFRSSLAAAIDAELRAGGSAQRAEREQAYLKSSLRHYGTSVPAVRAIAKATARRSPTMTRDQLVALVEALWAEPVHERLLVPLRLGRGDFERFGRYADAMLDEREFFIRKAIGWVLRDTGRTRPELVYDWLLPRARRASGVTIREALKPLSPAQRAAIESARRPRDGDPGTL